MTKRVLVVGGGIVGLTAAYFEAKCGHEVTLVEASDQLGGLLKSSETAHGSFDYGVHIASATGVDALDDFLFSDMDDLLRGFEVQMSGSFFNGELTHFSPFLNLNSLDESVSKAAGYDLIQHREESQAENLHNALLGHYGQTACEHAYFPFVEHTFGTQASELPTYYLNFFDMYRTVAFDAETTRGLKEVDYINQRLGFQEHTAGALKYYPIAGGIGDWTNAIAEKATKAGVKVLLNTGVNGIACEGAQYHVNLNDDAETYDRVVWTVTSALLTRFLPLNTKLQRPKFRKTALFDFVFKQPLLTDCNYINNFAAEHISTRLTCYQNLRPESDFYATTVEVLVDAIEDEQQLLAQVQQELVAMGVVDKANECLFSQYRPVNEGFPVITCENDRLLKTLNQEIAERYPNICLLGRSSSKGFFMSELLISAYESCQ